MKTRIVGFLAMTAAAVVFAQGKVTIQNDAEHLLIFPTSPSQVMAPDVLLTGQPVPTTGPLPSGVILVLGLYAGTSPNALTLVTAIVPINPAAGTGMPAGMITPTHAILPFEGGTLAYMQVRVWDAPYPSFEAAIGGGGYLGESAVFTMTPGLSTKLTYPAINTGGGTTWQGPIIVGGSPEPPRPFVSIVSQPTNQTVLRGDSVTFWVQATSNYPLNYQWFFNGTPIAGANGLSYIIPNAQPVNVGRYSVTASATSPYYGTVFAYSSDAMLTVLAPPAIVSSPSTQTAETGSTVLFSAIAEGDQPLVCWWLFNGTQTVGPATTNPTLTFSDIQPAQAGGYTVVVTNLWGAVTSAPAMLAVIPPVPRRLVPGIALTAQPDSWMNIDYKATPNALDTWTSFSRVYITNAPQFFFDVSDPLPPERIYRAWHSNDLAAPPGLDIWRVPAIILSGTVGSTLRLDGINQFGPTEAWVALATNTLTSTSQLYFDTSSIGQPPRLWRIVPVP